MSRRRDRSDSRPGPGASWPESDDLPPRESARHRPGKRAEKNWSNRREVFCSLVVESPRILATDHTAVWLQEHAARRSLGSYYKPGLRPILDPPFQPD